MFPVCRNLNTIPIQAYSFFNCFQTLPIFFAAKDRKSLSLQKTVRKPIFTERPKHTDVREGNDAVFSVRVSDEPDVAWYHDDKLLEDDVRVGLESEGDVFRLCIKDSKPEDAGRYKCVAKNSAGESSCTVSLRVKETVIPPEFEPLSETRYEVNEGDDVMLTAKVKGRPDPKITWFKDDVRLREDARLKTTNNETEHALAINRTTPLDSGMYKCTGSSPAGSASVVFELIVNGEFHWLYRIEIRLLAMKLTNIHQLTSFGT